MKFFIKRKMFYALVIAFFMVCMAFSACASGNETAAASTTLSKSTSPAQTATPQGGSQLSASLRYAQPGPLLKKLQPMVGTWQTQITLRQTPQATPVVSKELTTRWKWVVDGCYLQEEVTGQLGGAPYYRLGYLTYNNLDERYEFVTMDHFDTGFMTYQSMEDGSDTTTTLFGHFTQGGTGPTLAGQEIKIRYVFHWPDQNHMSEEMYFTPPAGTEYLVVQSVLTRKQ